MDNFLCLKINIFQNSFLILYICVQKSTDTMRKGTKMIEQTIESLRMKMIKQTIERLNANIDGMKQLLEERRQRIDELNEENLKLKNEILKLRNQRAENDEDEMYKCQKSTVTTRKGTKMTTIRVINYNDDIYIDAMYTGRVVSIINATQDYCFKARDIERTHEAICRYGRIIQTIDCFDNMRPEVWLNQYDEEDEDD